MFAACPRSFTSSNRKLASQLLVHGSLRSSQRGCETSCIVLVCVRYKVHSRTTKWHGFSGRSPEPPRQRRCRREGLCKGAAAFCRSSKRIQRARGPQGTAHHGTLCARVDVVVIQAASYLLSMQLTCLQNLCLKVSSLPHSPSSGSSSFQQTAGLLVEVLFLANSKPLHRQLVAWCRQLPADKFVTVGQLLVAVVNDATQRSTQAGNAAVQPVHVAEPLLSLLEAKPLQPFLR